jgi:ATP-binding cassette subfamily B protein
LKALGEYKRENVVVAKSLVALNMTQGVIISLGLLAALLVAVSKIVSGDFLVSDFIMINTYILQIYAPLNFLGTFWRFIRQSMSDVELVFELLEIDECIKESRNPHPIRI